MFNKPVNNPIILSFGHRSKKNLKCIVSVSAILRIERIPVIAQPNLTSCCTIILSQ